jgi:membrane-bound lytic murein transglycosylase A
MNRLLKILLLCCSTLLLGCFSKTSVSLVQTEPPLLSDDQKFSGLIDGIRQTIVYLKKTPEKEMVFGNIRITRGEYANALSELLSEWNRIATEDGRLSYLSKNFIFLRSSGALNKDKILLTGYFEPVLPGSKVRTNTFSQPLYGRPPNLLELRLDQFSPRFTEESPLRARATEREVLPYFSRSEIDGPQKVLAGQNLELVWVDPIEAFFLHIQGSGTVVLPDGEEIFLNYADKNGHRYEAIGKVVKERTGAQRIGMNDIVTYLRSVSARERDEILFKNPSYVFFRRSNQRATTATGIPAVSGRSIATDPSVFPKGALAFLSFRNPIDNTIISRLVLDHDTGGAIKGAGRVDLFCGRGESAKKMAGPLQDSSAEIYYLYPKASLPR